MSSISQMLMEYSSLEGCPTGSGHSEHFPEIPHWMCFWNQYPILWGPTKPFPSTTSAGQQPTITKRIAILLIRRGTWQSGVASPT